MKGIESVTSTLVSLMSSKLPAELSAIQIARADGIVLDPPQRIIDFQPTQEEVPERPLILVLAGETRFTSDTGTYGGGWGDATHRVAIAAALDNLDAAVLGKQLLRYQLAIATVLGKNRAGVKDADGDSAWAGLSLEATMVGDRFSTGAAASPYTSMTIVVCRVTRTEA